MIFHFITLATTPRLKNDVTFDYIGDNARIKELILHNGKNIAFPRNFELLDPTKLLMEHSNYSLLYVRCAYLFTGVTKSSHLQAIISAAATTAAAGGNGDIVSTSAQDAAFSQPWIP